MTEAGAGATASSPLEKLKSKLAELDSALDSAGGKISTTGAGAGAGRKISHGGEIPDPVKELSEGVSRVTDYIFPEYIKTALNVFKERTKQIETTLATLSSTDTEAHDRLNKEVKKLTEFLTKKFTTCSYAELQLVEIKELLELKEAALNKSNPSDRDKKMLLDLIFVQVDEIEEKLENPDLSEEERDALHQQLDDLLTFLTEHYDKLKQPDEIRKQIDFLINMAEENLPPLDRDKLLPRVKIEVYIQESRLRDSDKLKNDKMALLAIVRERVDLTEEGIRISSRLTKEADDVYNLYSLDDTTYFLEDLENCTPNELIRVTLVELQSLVKQKMNKLQSALDQYEELSKRLSIRVRTPAILSAVSLLKELSSKRGLPGTLVEEMTKDKKRLDEVSTMLKREEGGPQLIEEDPSKALEEERQSFVSEVTRGIESMPLPQNAKEAIKAEMTAISAELSKAAKALVNYNPNQKELKGVLTTLREAQDLQYSVAVFKTYFDLQARINSLPDSKRGEFAERFDKISESLKGKMDKIAKLTPEEVEELEPLDDELQAIMTSLDRLSPRGTAG